MAVDGRFPVAVTVTTVLLLATFVGCAVSYDRSPARDTLHVSPSLDSEHSSPQQQVHISLVGQDKMRVSWITSDPAPPTVFYGTSPGANTLSANGTTGSYDFLLYKSGQIHDVVVGPLTPNTVYYYRCGSKSAPELNFKTPPSQLPIKFAIVGDLGQTRRWTVTTLDRISKSNYDIFLLPGDLSYADYIQRRWDSFGNLIEPLASQRPWMVTQGNHEIEYIPFVNKPRFTPYNARWRMPFEESGSDSNLYYSFDVAGGVHVVMLGSYTDFDSDSSQYKWLEADLGKVDREKTPWIFALMHAPWYNSNYAHQGDSASIKMRESMEDLIYRARVDVVMAGHVHAYERFTRVYKYKADDCGPTYITVGAGGNREGLARRFIDPKPDISVFREASFSHGQLEVMNATHALWTWHRNDDDVQTAADSVWFISQYANPACRL